MPEVVIDLFKSIQINQQQRKAVTAPSCRRPAKSEALFQQPPVRQPGQRIVECRLLQLSVDLAQLRGALVNPRFQIQV